MDVSNDDSWWQEEDSDSEESDGYEEAFGAHYIGPVRRVPSCGAEFDRYFDKFADEEPDGMVSAQLRNQIESSDPDLVELKIGFGGLRPSHFEKDGKLIGGNTCLKELIIEGGWSKEGDLEMLFRGVSCSRSIQRLSFRDCDIGGEIFSILIPFFMRNQNFEHLKIDGCGLGRDGLRSLASALANFDSLKEFELCRSGVDEEELQELFMALAGHSNLRVLIMRANRIGKDACVILASMLLNPESKLSVLGLVNIGIDDEDAAYLAVGLRDNRTLKELDLSWNANITETGWPLIFAVLRGPSCRLEKLSLRNISNGDSTLSLFNALANNSSVRSLVANITRDRLPSFVQMLCNNSSIMATYHSNHTLTKFCYDDDDDDDDDEDLSPISPGDFRSLSWLNREHSRMNSLPEDLRSHLWFNREHSPGQAKRLKIIKHHFRKGFNVQPFVCMELNVQPHAMAWMCRDGKSDEVNGHFYEYLRRMPWVFDVKGKKTQNK